MPYLTEDQIRTIKEAIRGKYARVAATGVGGCFQYPTGREGLRQLGYAPELLRDLSESVLNAFSGVGNPFSLGPLHPGEAVLDIGCGAGVDTLIAARLVGPKGRAEGVDLTPEMVDQARGHAARMVLLNVHFQVAAAESLPFPDNDFDVVLSNGVFNLTVDKGQALQEAYRVLKPGGRLLLADQVLVAALPQDKAGRIENWYQ